MRLPRPISVERVEPIEPVELLTPTIATVDPASHANGEATHRQTSGELMRAERLRQRLTVADLARKADLSVGPIHSLELGHGGVLPKTFYAICYALQKPPAELYGSEQLLSSDQRAPMTTAGRNCRRFRYCAGMTQEEVARRIKVKASSITAFEAFGVLSEPDLIAKLAGAFEVSIADFRTPQRNGSKA